MPDDLLLKEVAYFEMTDYTKVSLTSPQLLGISFIENYRYYFGNSFDVKYPTIQDVALIFKDAYRQHQTVGELNSLIDKSEYLTRAELVDRLSALIKRSPTDANVVNLIEENIKLKENLDHIHTWIDKIRELKHDRRQLYKDLKQTQRDHDALKVSLHATRNTIKLLKEDNSDLEENSRNLSDRIRQAVLEKEQLEIALICKNTELLTMNASIKSKDSQLQRIISEMGASETQLETLSGLVKDLENQLLTKEYHFGGNLEEIEQSVEEFDQILSMLSESYELQMEQLIQENTQLHGLLDQT